MAAAIYFGIRPKRIRIMETTLQLASCRDRTRTFTLETTSMLTTNYAIQDCADRLDQRFPTWVPQDLFWGSTGAFSVEP